MLTNGQKRALHAAARQIGLTDAERRVIQRHLGGFFSAADATATREGFVEVMAHLEKLAGGTLAGCDAGYWRASADKAVRQTTDRGGPVERVLWRIRQEAKALGWTDDHVEAFLQSKHCSGITEATLETASAYWLRRLLDALVAIRRRETSRPPGARAGGGAAGHSVPAAAASRPARAPAADVT